jgi:hypothetical protein
LRGLEETSAVIIKAETQHIIGSVGLEQLDIKDKKYTESKEDEKECQRLHHYER